MRYGEIPKTLSDKILERISELNIFQYYIGHEFTIGSSFKSPLRKDSNPSFCIFQSDLGKFRYRFKDFGTGESGNCLTFVQKKYGYVDFYEALKQIDRDFGLGFTGGVYVNPKIEFNFPEVYKEVKKETIIQVKTRSWKVSDKKYWGQYELSCKTLVLFNVFPTEVLWINGSVYWAENPYMPIYSYYLGKDNNGRELYKALRINSPNSKWVTNAGVNNLQGYNQLVQSGELLIITKSLKDVMCLYQMGYHSIAPHSEGVSFNQDTVDELKSRFNRIVCLYDNDKQGINASKQVVELFGSSEKDNISVPIGCAKDISDYIKCFGSTEGRKLMGKLLNESSLDRN